MKCPKCQFDNESDAKFCNNCGQKLEMSCSKCGKANRPGSQFCKECAYDPREPKEAPPVDYSEPQSYTPKFLNENCSF